MSPRRRSGPNRKRCVDYFSSSSEDEDDDNSSKYGAGDKTKADNKTAKIAGITPTKEQNSSRRSPRNARSALTRAILDADNDDDDDDDSVIAIPSSSSPPALEKSHTSPVSDASSATLGSSSSPSWAISSPDSAQSPISHANTTFAGTTQILAARLPSPENLELQPSENTGEQQQGTIPPAEATMVPADNNDSSAILAVESLLELHRPIVRDSLETISAKNSTEDESLKQVKSNRQQEQRQPQDAVDSAMAVKRVVEKWTTIPEKKMQQPPLSKRPRNKHDPDQTIAEQTQHKTAPARVSLLESEPTPQPKKNKRKPKAAETVVEPKDNDKKVLSETDSYTSHPPAKKTRKQKQQACRGLESQETPPSLPVVGKKKASALTKKKEKDTMTATVIVEGSAMGKIEAAKLESRGAHHRSEITVATPTLVHQPSDLSHKMPLSDAMGTTEKAIEETKENNLFHETGSIAQDTSELAEKTGLENQKPRKRGRPKKKKDAGEEGVVEIDAETSQNRPTRGKKRTIQEPESTTQDTLGVAEKTGKENEETLNPRRPKKKRGAGEEGAVEIDAEASQNRPTRGKKRATEAYIPLDTAPADSLVAETALSVAKSETASAGKDSNSADHPEKVTGANSTKAEIEALSAERSSMMPHQIDNHDAATGSSPSKRHEHPISECLKSSEKTVQKKKKMSFQDQVLSHMLLTFKPFTLKSLAAELGTTETQLHHLMLSLTDKGIVSVKDFVSKGGKSKTLYWVADEARKTKELASLMASPDDIQATKGEYYELLRKRASMDQAMKAVTSEVSNEELDAKLASEEEAVRQLKMELTIVKARIEESKKPKPPAPSRRSSFGPPPKSAAELARERCPHRLKIRINNMRSEWVKRKETCLDFIDNLADGMEKKPKDVIKMLDMETDEAEGVKVPPKQPLTPTKKC